MFFSQRDANAMVTFMLIGIAASAIGLFVGVPWLIYFLWTHLAWIS